MRYRWHRHHLKIGSPICNAGGACATLDWKNPCIKWQYPLLGYTEEQAIGPTASDWHISQIACGLLAVLWLINHCSNDIPASNACSSLLNYGIAITPGPPHREPQGGCLIDIYIIKGASGGSVVGRLSRKRYPTTGKRRRIRNCWDLFVLDST